MKEVYHKWIIAILASGIAFYTGTLFGEFQALKIGVSIMAKYLNITGVDATEIARALMTYSHALGL